VFCLAVLVYSNTPGNGFVFDDRVIIEQNPLIRSLDGIPRLFVTPYWTGEGRANRLYRPLTTATFALNRALGNGGPSGFHLVNALLHGTSAVLLFLLLVRLFRLRWMALGASALFAVHPVLTESVAGLVGRAEILSTLFLLAALLLDRGGEGGRGPAVLGSLGFFFLALLSKENALAYPALLILTDLLLGPPKGTSRRGRRGEIAAALAVAAVYLLLRWKVLGSLMETSAIPEVDNLLVGVPAWRRILTGLALSARYLGLFLFPARLSADYSAREIEPVSGILDPACWLGIAVAGAFLILFHRFRRRLVPLSWGMGFAAVSFFLVSNIPFPVGTIFAERLLYLPLAGLCAGAGFLASVAAEKRPRTVAAVGAAVLALLAARTWERNRDWRDDFSLFRSAARVSPRSARVHYNLGNAYRRRGEPARAEESYRACLEIYPDFEPAGRNLGVVLVELGRGAEAIEFFRQALERHPESASLHNNLGNAYRSLGRGAEAEAEYNRALEMGPSSADARNNLGALFLDRGDAAWAEVEFREAIRLSPDRIAFRVNLGNLLLQRGDPARAARVFREAKEREPLLPEPHRGLGEALLGEGRILEAEAELMRSLSLNPSQWEAPALLGYLHQRRGDGGQAIRFYLESLSRKPDQPELHRNLGILYSGTGGTRDKALEHFRRCLALNPPPGMEKEIRDLLEALERGTIPGPR